MEPLIFSFFVLSLFSFVVGHDQRSLCFAGKKRKEKKKRTEDVGKRQAGSLSPEAKVPGTKVM